MGAGRAGVGVSSRLVSRGAAGRAGASGVHPVSVGVEAIFDERFWHVDAILGGEFPGFFPGGDLEADEFYISCIFPVIEQAMRQFMQGERGRVWQLGGIGNGLSGG